MSYVFDLGKDHDGNDMPSDFGVTPVTINSADAEISYGRFLTTMQEFLDDPSEGLCPEDHYKLTAVMLSLEKGYYAALEAI